MRKSVLKASGICAALVATALWTGTQAWGADSIVLSNSEGRYTVPNAAPFNSLTEVRIEMRMHDWVRPTSGCKGVFSTGQYYFGFRLCAPGTGAGEIQFCDGLDVFSSGQGNCAGLEPSGATDILVRGQRDPANLRLTLEIWGVDGALYRESTVPIDALRPYNTRLPDLAALGDSEAQLAYVRWHSTLAQMGKLTPFGLAGDLASWDFEKSLSDSSNRHLNISGRGAYALTPKKPPLCNAGVSETFQVGLPWTLNGTDSISPDTPSAPLQYRWEQTGGASVEWVGVTSEARVSAKAAVFGTYRFRLTVTDGENQSSSCTVVHGGVLSDGSVVRTGDVTIDRILGPMVQFGKNPWPWYDDRHRAWADHFGKLQQEARYKDDWNDALAGTVSVVKGSNLVTGSGTSLRTVFCGGGEKGADDTWFVLWRPIEGTQFYSRRAFHVKRCISESEIELSSSIPVESSPALQFSKWGSVGLWVNGSENVNYYDNVLAYYSLYFRSGIDTYRDYARTLADRWWSMPYNDEGRSCSLDGSGACLAPRIQSQTGLYLRALDGRPDMWPGLRRMADLNIVSMKLDRSNEDIREEAYRTAFVALCAIADPDAEQRQKCREAVADEVRERWAANQKEDRSWHSAPWGYSCWNGGSGTVTVTNGSREVVGAGTTWTAGPRPGETIWFTKNCHPREGGDPAAYGVTFTDATHLTLDRPYEGESGSGRGFQVYSLSGYGTQPFMMGVVGAALGYAAVALEESEPALAGKARQMTVDAANWIIDEGYWADYGGLYYGRNFVNCEPDPTRNASCAGASLDGSSSAKQTVRYLAMEVMHAFARAEQFSGDARIREYGDLLYGRLYGGMGGPNADTEYLYGVLADRAYDFTTNKAKTFGFGFGWGLGSLWPAARQHSVAEPATAPRRR